MEARAGQAPVGGVKISDNWLRGDGIDGVRGSNSSFVPPDAAINLQTVQLLIATA
jgi:hypothetical protein